MLYGNPLYLIGIRYLLLIYITFIKISICADELLLPLNTNDLYSPFETECPSYPLIRKAEKLSDEEARYMLGRQGITNKAIRRLLKRLDIPGLDISHYQYDQVPVIALAISGGGYRSMLTAGGVVAAFDDRVDNTTEKGHLGGLLQSTSYIAGVSGGGWLVSSLALYNYLPVTYISHFWNINEPLLEGVPNFDVTRTNSDDETNVSLKNLLKQTLSKPEDTTEGNPMTDVLQYYKNLHFEVRSKKTAGFNLSFTDYWGRAISKKIFPEFRKSPGITLTDITRTSSFKNYEQPFSILIANLQKPGEELSNLNSQILEFTPFEFGSWDNILNHFIKVKYLGSDLFNGVPNLLREGHKRCIKNFDNLGFITGTSSSLFNDIMIYIWQATVTSTRENYLAVKSILSAFGLNLDKLDNSQNVLHSDYAIYSPNPFHGVALSKEYQDNLINKTTLYLADGGEDGENIPFQPLLQKYRKVDVIFAIDSTSDIDNWPNGTTINLTSERYHSNKSSYYVGNYTGLNNFKYFFPQVPTLNDIVDHNLNARPLFLGCNLTDYIGWLGQLQLPPLIVYMANSPQSFYSNTSTFKLTYNDTETNEMIQNGYNIATYKNSTLDNKYSQCVGCAILKRDFDRKVLTSDFEVPIFCQECFNDYCWKNN